MIHIGQAGVDDVQRKLKIALMIFGLVAVFAAGFLWYNWQLGSEGGSIASVFHADNSDSDQSLESRVNILLIGADQRPGETAFNTDSLILASIDPDTKRISLLSIPRDTRVELRGHGYVKINSVAALENLDTLQIMVADLFDVPIKGYVLTNFSGFKDIIDTLGGITVDVEKDMLFETGDKVDGYINLKKGVQRLDGSKALQYARFRHDALADISRTARQQVVLKAVAKEMFKLSTIPKLPVLVPQIMKAVQTNLPSLEILKLVRVAVSFDANNVISQTLPGSFMDLDGVSYWYVNPDQAKKVVRDLFNGITTNKVIDNTDVDLLKPLLPPKSLPKVPGNSVDPNGQGSSGHDNLPAKPGVPGGANDQPGSTQPGTQPGNTGGTPAPGNTQPGDGLDQPGWPAGPDGAA